MTSKPVPTTCQAMPLVDRGTCLLVHVCRYMYPCTCTQVHSWPACVFWTENRHPEPPMLCISPKSHGSWLFGFFSYPWLSMWLYVVLYVALPGAWLYRIRVTTAGGRRACAGRLVDLGRYANHWGRGGRAGHLKRPTPCGVPVSRRVSGVVP